MAVVPSTVLFRSSCIIHASSGSIVLTTAKMEYSLRSEVGDFILESSSQNAWFSCRCYNSLRANKSEQGLRHNLSL